MIETFISPTPIVGFGGQLIKSRMKLTNTATCSGCKHVMNILRKLGAEKHELKRERTNEQGFLELK